MAGRAYSQGRLAPRREAAPGLRMAWALSLAGFIPFLFVAIFVLVADRGGVWHALVVDAGRTYGAAILSFLGGTRWGAGLGRPDAGRQFAMSVVPATRVPVPASHKPKLAPSAASPRLNVTLRSAGTVRMKLAPEAGRTSQFASVAAPFTMRDAACPSAARPR